MAWGPSVTLNSFRDVLSAAAVAAESLRGFRLARAEARFKEDEDMEEEFEMEFENEEEEELGAKEEGRAGDDGDADDGGEEVKPPLRSLHGLLLTSGDVREVMTAVPSSSVVKSSRLLNMRRCALLNSSINCSC